MAGYLSTKAVFLSTTAASVTGNATIGGDLTVDTNTLYVDSTNNRVGIGTSSPNQTLDVKAATGGGISITPTAGSATNYISWYDTGGGPYGRIGYDHDASAMTFTTVTSERCRIDSSGNLLVGKTAINVTTEGAELRATGQAILVADGTNPILMNRLTSDGDIAVFRKDGSTVGSIGAAFGELYLGSGTGSATFLRFGYSTIVPADAAGANRDNSIDLGSSIARFDDIYATNGTIQTSDQNEKQQIASLTDAEITAAKAISKLFKTFKWNDSVAEKGDAARTHSGVIAQDVEQAMTDAGLNAGDYAFFISSDWVDEETGEERNRKGIRYPQLLSFIGAATEQRLASIEARLDALETA